jgi:aryl-alcohol dehydrogenase-like predicted oxidoreductase
MNYRELGQTGIKISEIGFGAWGIGGPTPGPTSYGETDDKQSMVALERALEKGINFFDTSAVYGYGHSEKLIGEAFHNKRDQVVIATKAGLDTYGKAPDFSVANLERSLSQSLQRLKTDYIDLFQLHNPSEETLLNGDKIQDFAERQIAKGTIRAFGLSLRGPEDCHSAIEKFSPAALQINFNLLDQRIIDHGVMTLAERAKVSLIARTPLCFGFLTGALTVDTQFDPADHRSRWPRVQIENWVNLARQMYASANDNPAQTESQFALRYPLSFSAITSTIPGIFSAEEVDINAAASDMGSLSEEELTKVSAIFCAAEDFENADIEDPGKVEVHG